MTENEYLELSAAGKLPAGHTYMFAEDDVYMYCECGKWIEEGTYDHWDHLTAIGY